MFSHEDEFSSNGITGVWLLIAAIDKQSVLAATNHMVEHFVRANIIVDGSEVLSSHYKNDIKGILDSLRTNYVLIPSVTSVKSTIADLLSFDTSFEVIGISAIWFDRIDYDDLEPVPEVLRETEYAACILSSWF